MAEFWGGAKSKIDTPKQNFWSKKQNFWNKKASNEANFGQKKPRCGSEKLDGNS